MRDKALEYHLKVENAVTVLRCALLADDSMRATYKANIAVAFKDEFKAVENQYIGSDKNIHEVIDEIANKAADRFLDLFIANK